MAYVPGFKYDLFVSYAHADNHAMPGERGWVSELILRLEHKLIQRLGGTSDLKIFRDSGEVSSNYSEDELLVAVRNSAMFLAIASPSYAKKMWTRDEFEAFVGVSKEDPKRLFTIECLPRGIGDPAYPARLEKAIRAPFFETSEDRRTHSPITREASPRLFDVKLNDLAQDMSDKLAEMQKAHVSPTSPRVSIVHGASNGQMGPAARDGKKKILLAESTEDLESEYEDLRDYLLQYDDQVTLLSPDGYPMGGEAFRAAVEADIAQADIFVQLLGASRGRNDRELGEPHPRFQYHAARAAGRQIVQWRSSNLNLEDLKTSIKDPEYLEMLEGETVVSSGLESLKKDLMKLVKKMEPKPVKPIHSTLTVFINGDTNDKHFVMQVKQECLKNALTVFLPAKLTQNIDPNCEYARKDLEDNLAESDVLVFIYGNTTHEWIAPQLRRLNKVGSNPEFTPKKLVAIYTGPPPKADIGIEAPNWTFISSPTDWDLEPLRKLLSEVTA
jgi:hypothetical protein